MNMDEFKEFYIKFQQEFAEETESAWKLEEERLLAAYEEIPGLDPVMKTTLLTAMKEMWLRGFKTGCSNTALRCLKDMGLGNLAEPPIISPVSDPSLN